MSSHLMRNAFLLVLAGLTVTAIFTYNRYQSRNESARLDHLRELYAQRCIGARQPVAGRLREPGLQVMRASAFGAIGPSLRAPFEGEVSCEEMVQALVGPNPSFLTNLR